MLRLYEMLKKGVGIFFNLLNSVLGGNLPPFACVCVVVEEQKRYLVIERPNGGVAFPGGFMRWREYPEQSAERECREETGIAIHIGPLISYCSLKSKAISHMSTMIIIYQGKVRGGKLKSSIEGRAFWISEDELRMRATPLTINILDNYRRYQEEQKVIGIHTTGI